MTFTLLDHTLLPYSRNYLCSIYLLRNSFHNYCYGCTPNGEIGISIVLSGEGYIEVDKGHWVKQPPFSVYGLVQQVQFNMMSEGYYEVNIGFTPQFLQLFMKDSMSSLLKKQATDLYDLFRTDLVNKLTESLYAATTKHQILLCIESFLEATLIQQSLDKRIQVAHNLIVSGQVNNVARLSSILNTSTTTLRNLFNEKVGISPKDLIKICRIKKALCYGKPDEETLTSMAYDLGYYDQAHFIHDFKNAIGLTPKKYFDNEKLTFDFYNFQRWSKNSFDA